MLDLSLFPELKQKRLIGLGEMAHGSNGLHGLAAQLVKSAVLELGTRTFGLEAPMGVVEAINAKISASSASPLTRADLGDLYPIWRSENIFDLLTWIYEFNHRHDRPGREIKFVGFDIRLPVPELGELVAWAQSQGLASQDLQVLKNYPTVAKMRELEMLSFQGKASEASTSLVAISKALGQIAALSAPPQRIQFLLERLRSWVKVYEVWSGSGKFEPGHLERDQQMAWLLEKLLPDRSQEGPAVILAHLNHLLRHNLEVENARPHVVAGPMLGSLLDQALGEQFAVIGLFADKVGLADANHPPENFASQRGSFENLLHQSYGNLALKRVTDLPESLRARVRVGDVLPAGKPQLGAYSDFFMIPGRQMDYVVIAGRAPTQKPF